MHLIPHALVSLAQVVVGGQRERRVLGAVADQRGLERLHGHRRPGRHGAENAALRANGGGRSRSSTAASVSSTATETT